MALQVEVAVDHRTVDKELLVQVASGRIACAIVSRLLNHCKSRVQTPLDKRIRQYYSTHIFHSMSRLDVPTFEDPAVQQQMEAAWSTSGRSSVCWETIQMTSSVASTLIRLFSQVSVLISVLYNQRDGPLLTILSFGDSIFQWVSARRRFIDTGGMFHWLLCFNIFKVYSVWAATSTNEDYLRMEGMKRVVNDPVHRQEIVAGNMSEYLTKRKPDSQAWLTCEMIFSIRIPDSSRTPWRQGGWISRLNERVQDAR